MIQVRVQIPGPPPRGQCAGDHLLQHYRLAGFDVLLPATGPERLDVQLPPCNHWQLPAMLAIPCQCGSGAASGTHV